MFIHVVGQFLASIAILSSVFGFADSLSVLISMVLIGKIKFFMLHIIMVLSAAMSLYKGGGWLNIVNHLPQDVNMLSFVDYGIKPAAIDMFSMLVGVLSTQIYLQAIFLAKKWPGGAKRRFLACGSHSPCRGVRDNCRPVSPGSFPGAGA